MAAFNFFVLGQGIAGSLLAWELERQGQNVAIIDQHRAGAASRVASGMWNPITFRLLLKSWRADTLLPVALDYYADICRHFQGDWLHLMPIHRIFPNLEGKEMWQAKSLDADYKHLLGEMGEVPADDAQLRYPFGYGEVKQSGWLEINPLLDRIRNHFKEKEALFETDFKYDALDIATDQVTWQGHSAKKIIFAEGSSLSRNPWFQWLPLKPAQGDVLTLHMPGLDLHAVYNAGFFILPLGNDQYRLGATYEWDILDPNPTPAGKQELLDKLATAYQGPYTIINHQAGIRPAVADRRPLLGLHPEHQSLAVFNGLGTKGVLLAPYFARHMAAFLTKQETLEAEVNINRFRKRFAKSREAQQEF